MMIRELHTSYRTHELPAGGEWVLDCQLTTPRGAAAVICALPMPSGRLDECVVEHFGMLALDSKRRVTAFALLSIGTLDACMVTPRDVFRAAIAANASSVMVWHNHPSGDPTPSRDDITLTARLSAAGVVVGIPLLDHVVVGSIGRYSSMQEAGHHSAA